MSGSSSKLRLAKRGSKQGAALAIAKFVRCTGAGQGQGNDRGNWAANGERRTANGYYFYVGLMSSAGGEGRLTFACKCTSRTKHPVVWSCPLLPMRWVQPCRQAHGRPALASSAYANRGAFALFSLNRFTRSRKRLEGALGLSCRAAWSGVSFTLRQSVQRTEGAAPTVGAVTGCSPSQYLCAGGDAQL